MYSEVCFYSFLPLVRYVCSSNSDMGRSIRGWNHKVSIWETALLEKSGYLLHPTWNCLLVSYRRSSLLYGTFKLWLLVSVSATNVAVHIRKVNPTCQTSKLSFLTIFSSVWVPLWSWTSCLPLISGTCLPWTCQSTGKTSMQIRHWKFWWVTLIQQLWTSSIWKMVFLQVMSLM